MEGLRGSVVVSALLSFCLAAAACSTTVNEGGPGSSNPSSNGSDAGTNSQGDGGSPSSDGQAQNPGDKPAASNAEANIELDGTCPSFTACGGNPSGTYDYTAGCIDDVFANARQQCPGLDTSKAKVTIKGSIYFLANSALHRAITVTTSGSITFPQSCTAGQCATVENALKGTFDSVSCTGSSDCTCTISNVESESDATTYTISGSTVTTGDGEKYSICEKSGTLEYKGKSAGAEEGVWTLKKR
jgi:hypothetical protein